MDAEVLGSRHNDVAMRAAQEQEGDTDGPKMLRQLLGSPAAAAAGGWGGGELLPLAAVFAASVGGPPARTRASSWDLNPLPPACPLPSPARRAGQERAAGARRGQEHGARPRQDAHPGGV